MQSSSSLTLLLTSISLGLSVGLSASPARAEAPPPELVTAVRTYTLNRGDEKPPEFKHALVDLNGDNVNDAVVLLTGSLWCGTGGCRMIVFKGKTGAYVPHSTSTISREPIRVLPEKLHGWHTLIVNTKGMGDVLMPHGTKSYPANPSMQKGATPSQLSTAKTLIN